MPEEANDDVENDSDFDTSSNSSFDSDVDSDLSSDEFDNDAADHHEESSAIAPITTYNTSISTLPKLPIMQKSNKKTVVYSLSKHKM